MKDVSIVIEGERGTAKTSVAAVIVDALAKAGILVQLSLDGGTADFVTGVLNDDAKLAEAVETVKERSRLSIVIRHQIDVVKAIDRTG